MNWDVFTDNCTDPDELVDRVTLYVKFCKETVVNQRLKGTPEPKETCFFEG